MRKLYHLKNKTGLEVVLSNYGAGIVDILSPNRSGVIESILVTPRKTEKWFDSQSYFGKTCGRTAGRIQNGKFFLNNIEYTIDTIEPNALHGGKEGLSFKEFLASPIRESADTSFISFVYQSIDNEGGYPGKLTIEVIYTLFQNRNEFVIDYRAISDKDTLCNLTNHAYFNLSGNVKQNILNHNLMINASTYGEIIDGSIPRGITSVNPVMDFRISNPIKDHINDDSISKGQTNGYDHPYILEKDGMKPQVVLSCLESGREMEIRTSYPVVVVYTCNYMEDIKINNGHKLEKNDAVCLECQYYPNSINSEDIQDKKDVLKANKEYKEKISYTFRTI